MSLAEEDKCRGCQILAGAVFTGCGLLLPFNARKIYLEETRPKQKLDPPDYNRRTSKLMRPRTAFIGSCAISALLVTIGICQLLDVEAVDRAMHQMLKSGARW